jgi:hypothetical protein
MDSAEAVVEYHTVDFGEAVVEYHRGPRTHPAG